MSTGWICPRCETVYAPFVQKCHPCSRPNEQPPLNPGTPAWPVYPTSPWYPQTWSGSVPPPEPEDKP